MFWSLRSTTFAEQLGLQSWLNGLIATFFVNGETGGKAATSSLFLTSGRGEFHSLRRKELVCEREGYS